MNLLFQVSSWHYECQPDGVVTVTDWTRTETVTLLALFLLRPGRSRCAAGPWRCCWPGGCAAGPVRAQRTCGGHDELECAASPVDVLLARALRCRAAAVPGQSESSAGQWENSKAATLESSLTQSCHSQRKGLQRPCVP